MLDLPVVLACADRWHSRVRYVVDSLMLAANVRPVYLNDAPLDGPWLLYTSDFDQHAGHKRCIRIFHSPAVWEGLQARKLDTALETVGDLAVLRGGVTDHADPAV